MTNPPLDLPALNPEAFDLACKELFLTITAHKSAADVLGFDWKLLKASTRKPWETATRKVLTAYFEEDGTDEANARMAAILLATANALKGEPEPLSSHSWHDLAEDTKALTARAEAAEKAVAKVRQVHSQKVTDRWRQRSTGDTNAGEWVTVLMCAGCSANYPCATITALDDTP